MSPRTVYTLATLVVLVCVVVVASVHSSLPAEQVSTLLLEVAKTFLQLGAIGVVGALVKATIDQVAVHREKRAHARELTKEVLARLREAHSIVRSIQVVEEAHTRMRVNAFITDPQ